LEKRSKRYTSRVLNTNVDHPQWAPAPKLETEIGPDQTGTRLGGGKWVIGQTEMVAELDSTDIVHPGRETYEFECTKPAELDANQRLPTQDFSME
jgi:hypothetical protein